MIDRHAFETFRKFRRGQVGQTEISRTIDDHPKRTDLGTVGRNEKNSTAKVRVTQHRVRNQQTPAEICDVLFGCVHGTNLESTACGSRASPFIVPPCSLMYS